MFGENITYGQAGIVCIFSLVVVFVVLLSISYLIDIVAWFLRRSEEKEKVPEAPAAVPAPVSVPEPAAADSHIDVVVITAAVAACLGADSSTFVVRSIRRLGPEESDWSRTGRLDSLQ